MAQLDYGYQGEIGIAGTLFDLTAHAVDSRTVAGDGVKFGCGVVRGTNVGKDVIAAGSDASTETFEGVAMNGLTHQADVGGGYTIKAGETVGVLKNGRAWVQVSGDVAYGDPLCLVTSGDDAGKFGKTGLALDGYFLTANKDGLAAAYVNVVPGTTSEGGSTGDTGNDEP